MTATGICIGLGDNATAALAHRVLILIEAEKRGLPHEDREVNGQTGICVGLGDGTQQQKDANKKWFVDYAKFFGLHHEEVDDCC